MEFSEDLNTLLKEVCKEFKKKNLGFCLSGGWAASILGTTRTTVDIDILIILDKKSREVVASILQDAFRVIQSHETDMKFKSISIWRHIVSLKGSNNPYVLDLIAADSDYLRSVVERSVEIDYEDSVIPLVAIEDLIILKLISFRKQDQLDIENLIGSGNPIDWAYLENIISRLNLNRDYIFELKEK